MEIGSLEETTNELKAALESAVSACKDENIISLSMRRGGLMLIAFDGRIFFAAPGEEQAKSIVPFYEYHKILYRARPSVNCIIHTASPWLLTSSMAGRNVPAMLDDMAQIAGVSSKIFRPSLCGADSRRVIFPFKVKVFGKLRAWVDGIRFLIKMRGRDAVFFKDAGALCAGRTFFDSNAVCRILEKNSQCFIFASILGGRPLKFSDASRMRYVYKHSYSKRADKKR